MKTQTLKVTLLLLVFSCILVQPNLAFAYESKSNATKIAQTTASETETPSSPNVQISSNTDDKYFEELSELNEKYITTDEELTIEGWMINDQLFRFEINISEEVDEEPLIIEDWMTDQVSWKF